MKPTLFIDADDTLWESEIYYQQSIAAFAKLMASLGFEEAEAEHTAEVVERERVPQVGYAPQEFCRSLVLAYQRLCQLYERPVDDEVSAAVEQIGQAVVEYPIVLLAGVADTLPRLRGHYRLLLLTKGDQTVQQGKLARSGLGHLFDGVHVVPEKDAGVIRDLLTRYELQPAQTWMVGNSPRSDINPALEAGIGAVYIPHANTWDFEQEELADPERMTLLHSFGDLADLLLDVVSPSEEG